MFALLNVLTITSAPVIINQLFSFFKVLCAVREFYSIQHNKFEIVEKQSGVMRAVELSRSLVWKM